MMKMNKFPHYFTNIVINGKLAVKETCTDPHRLYHLLLVTLKVSQIFLIIALPLPLKYFGKDHIQVCLVSLNAFWFLCTCTKYSQNPCENDTESLKEYLN